MELVNPDYALFECVSSGLYKPNRNSSVNPSHLEYFKLTGTMMAKAICEGQLVSKYHTSIWNGWLTRILYTPKFLDDKIFLQWW